MPVSTTQGQQLGTQSVPWWRQIGKGINAVLGNVSFQSGPNGFTFSGSGGGTNQLPAPPSTASINAWLPYAVGGVVLIQLLKK